MQVTFNRRQRKSLREMAEDLKTTEAEVILRALGLFYIGVEETKGGNELGVIKGNKIIKYVTGITFK